MDRTPFRVPHHLPAVRPVGRKSDSPEVSAPFHDVTRTSPSWSGVSSTPTPVPPAGFYNLSAVSWQIRACGLVSCRCRAWVTSPFRASPRRDRAPVSGSPAPLRSSPRNLRALTRPCHHRVSPTPSPSLGLLPVSPQRLWAPFRRADHGRLASRSPWTARSGLAPDHADHPLRSLIPPAKLALPTPQVSPQEQPCSPGRSAPPESSPPAPWTL